MECFIKDKHTFETVRMLTVTDYEVTTGSIYDENSSITVQGEITGYEGDYIVLDGWTGLISSTTADRGITTVTAKDIITTFDRPLTGATGTTIEGFISAQLTSQYKNLSDAFYNMPYLEIHTNTQTPYIDPDFDDNGLYNLKSYIAKVRRLKGVQVKFRAAGDILRCDIQKTTPQTKTVDFADDANRLISESYSKNTTAKVTTITNGVATDFYAHGDGTYSTTNADRIEGEWVVLAVPQVIKNNVVDQTATTEKVNNAVAEQFAKSSYSHMIEFYSRHEFEFYDPLRIRIGNKVLSSYISAIRKSMKDNTLYKSGELRVTLTDKLKEMI